ncbi:MAG TPA: hypothetical protein VFM09_02225 [Marmoricola sp.]|nr:hypothetical protein [Marmoricola sp.]
MRRERIRQPRSRTRGNPVPARLAEEIEEALARVDTARERARAASAARGVALAWRRQADAALDRAYGDADQLLRQATELARAHSRHAWAGWRSRLSALDLRRQEHLLAVGDRPANLQLGSIRTVDSGMTKPLIGEMPHGASKPAGSPARYGIDLEEVLRRTDALPTVTEQLAGRARVNRASAAARSAAPAPGSAAGDLPPAA